MIHSILQVIPTKEYTVYLYFASGEIRLFDASGIIKKGIFSPLQDINLFTSTCTVLNHTLAWDLKGNYDPYECLDLDPEQLYQASLPVEDPLKKFA